jgi:ABC-type glycerol-3-phosphate transport system permease component
VEGLEILEKSRLTKDLTKHVILILVCLIILIPFFWTLSTSLKPKSYILTYPPKFLPIPLTLENYIKVLSQASFLRYIINSIIVSFFSVILSVVISIHAGYAAARYDFIGKNFCLFLILVGQAVGQFSIIVPLYVFASKLDLLDSYLILVLSYSAWAIPLGTWLMQGYYKTIPPNLEEAAMIDGCSRFSAFYKVVVPTVMPGIIATAVMAMVHTWNEFILAVVLTSSNEMRTLPVGIHFFLSYYGVDWGGLTAATIVSIGPVLIVFLCLQRRFVQGLTSGALGGM